MTADKPSLFVPRLRFPEFEDGPRWNELPLSSASDLNPPNEGLPESFIYIDLESVKNGILVERREIARDTAPSRAQRLLRRKDIIYQTVRPYQRNNLLFDIDDGYEYVASTGYAQLRAHGCPEFLYQLVHTDSFVNSVLAQCTGSNYPAINSSDLASIYVALPQNPEQQKIADCLGSLDDLMAAEGWKLQALRQHKQGLMQQLFPQPGETVPRLRFPEFQDAPDWKIGPCRDIAEVLPGYGFPDKFQGNKKGQYPFYKVSDISHAVEKGQRYISEANNYIDSDALDEIRGKPVPAGTIIFAKIGEAIRSNRRVVTTTSAVIDNNTAGVKAIKTKSADEFLFYLWSNVSLIDHAGGVVPAVSKSALENVPLCYPSDPKEQQRIADCLSTLDDQIGVQARKLDTLKQHKQGLLQKLFPSFEG